MMLDKQRNDKSRQLGRLSKLLSLQLTTSLLAASQVLSTSSSIALTKGQGERKSERYEFQRYERQKPKPQRYEPIQDSAVRAGEQACQSQLPQGKVGESPLALGAVQSENRNLPINFALPTAPDNAIVGNATAGNVTVGNATAGDANVCNASARDVTVGNATNGNGDAGKITTDKSSSENALFVSNQASAGLPPDEKENATEPTISDATPTSATDRKKESASATAEQNVGKSSAQTLLPEGDVQQTSKTRAASLERAENRAAVASAVAMIGAEVSTTVLQTKSTEQGEHASSEKSAEGEPTFIDNDEAKETTQTIEYKDPETDETGTKIKVGATFPVVVSSELTSKSAQKGDPIEARLKYDLKIGDRIIAEKGATVVGHINYALKARSAMHSLISPERWYRNSGCLGLSFDEIINAKGEHIPLIAAPARKARIVRNKAEGRELGVNQYGQVTGPWSQQLRYKAIRIGLNAAMTPAGVFSFGAMPVALGVIGAVNPSFAFMKPVGQNVRHRRIKGFVWGALSGVPGSWIVEDTVIKGQEAVIKPGDEFLAAFREEFTGEPVDASQNQGTSSKVNGEVIPRKKTRKS
jgi:hypothetical protein